MIYFLFIITVIILILDLPTVKGFVGEAIVKIVIGRNSTDLKKPKFVINNLLLESSPGRTSQIDHVVINPNGVFVIETKNYAGRIYGTDSQQNWTQVLNYGKVKNHFYSPVKQNITHVHVITELLAQDTPVFSIIVFVKGNIRFIKSQSVYTISGMIHRLKAPSEITLSFDDMHFIYNTLIKHNKSDIISKAEHIDNIKKSQEDISQGICPRCGSNLVVRHGKNGDFIGCSGFPHCRFTKNIDRHN